MLNKWILEPNINPLISRQVYFNIFYIILIYIYTVYINKHIYIHMFQIYVPHKLGVSLFKKPDYDGLVQAMYSIKGRPEPC